MTTEHCINNDNDNGDHSSVISDTSDRTLDIDLFKVFNALESIGFRFPDYHEN